MFLCILAMVNTLLTRRERAAVRGKPRPAPALDGIRRADWVGRPNAARRLAAVLADRGEVAYCVGDANARGSADHRADAREAIRMRSAKILDAAFRYLGDGRICDRSLHRLRLLLARNVRLPRRFAVHVDETGDVRRAVAVWRRGLLVGVRLHERPPADALKASDLAALRARYYGIPD